MSGPVKRRHRRVWPKGRIPIEFFGDSGRHQLTPAHERKLGPAAIGVWRELLLVRGHQARPCQVSLVQLLVNVRSRSALYLPPSGQLLSRWLATSGWSPSRVDRAIRRLKDAGLIAYSSRAPVLRLVDGVKQFTSTLHLMVRGAVEDVGPKPELWVPSETIAWCERARGRGGYRHGKRGQTDAKGSQTDAEPRIENAGLEGQTDASKISNGKCSSSVLSEQKNAAAGAAVAFGTGGQGEKRRTTADLPRLPLDHELMYRRREAHYYQRALEADRLADYARRPATTWDARYAELRRWEIEAGAIDPMERYWARKGGA